MRIKLCVIVIVIVIVTVYYTLNGSRGSSSEKMKQASKLII